MQTSLFPESAEKRMERFDDLILHLICGGEGGPLNLQLEENEKTVLQCLRYKRGQKNAMQIREIHERTKLDPRTIKQAVRTLRLNFHLPIASWKHSDKGGYYLIVDEADRAAWVKDMTDQIRSEIAVLRAAAGHQAHLELLGQLQLDAGQESEAAHV
jgi:predicted transcriptional regulator